MRQKYRNRNALTIKVKKKDWILGRQRAGLSVCTCIELFTLKTQHKAWELNLTPLPHLSLTLTFVFISFFLILLLPATEKKKILISGFLWNNSTLIFSMTHSSMAFKPCLWQDQQMKALIWNKKVNCCRVSRKVIAVLVLLTKMEMAAVREKGSEISFKGSFL